MDLGVSWLPHFLARVQSEEIGSTASSWRLLYAWGDRKDSRAGQAMKNKVLVPWALDPHPAHRVVRGEQVGQWGQVQYRTWNSTVL
jgi:hypothetical protein